MLNESQAGSEGVVWSSPEDEEAAEPHAEQREGWRRWITRRRVMWGALGIVGAFLALILLLLITAPLSKSLQPITAPSLTLLSAEGVPIARRGAVVEEPVDAAALPDHVVQPFLAIEDRRFHEHFGIDPRGLARALVANLRNREVVEGGSTITQQLAKLAFLSPDQTLWRKLQEVVLAFWLEARLDKNDILSRYLSGVYFGDNVFGLRAAAKHYFSREPEELSLEQATLLAGLLKAPSALNPTDNLEAARERSEVVIQAMVDAGMLTAGEAEALPQVTLAVGGLEEVPSGSYFADWVFPQAEAQLDERYPSHTVTTTLEDRLQRDAVAAIRSVGTGGAQVALVAMRRDGSVVAMVGGNSYASSPFNRATQALRQPGSTFKLFVYLAALREGLAPSTRIADRPLRIGNWSPDNYENRYRGEISLREAFAHSSNVAAVRIAERVGRDKVAAAARDLGITSELETGPTMSLGTSGVSLIEMVGAYAAVAAGRFPVQPRGLPRGDEADAKPMDDEVRARMLQLLQAVVQEGSGRGARLTTPAFGKTGTSQDSRDAYFIGFSGDLITGVWIGHDDNRPVPGAQGGGTPAAIWRAFMTRALTPADAAPAHQAQPRQAPAQPEAPAGPPAVTREYDVAPEPLDLEDADAGEPLAEPRDIPVIDAPAPQAPPVQLPDLAAPPPEDEEPAATPAEALPASDEPE